MLLSNQIKSKNFRIRGEGIYRDGKMLVGSVVWGVGLQRRTVEILELVFVSGGEPREGGAGYAVRGEGGIVG